MRSFRTHVGRALIHLGLRVLPQGRARSELYNLIDQWATHVYRTVAAAQQKEPHHD